MVTYTLKLLPFYYAEIEYKPKHFGYNTLSVQNEKSTSMKSLWRLLPIEISVARSWEAQNVHASNGLCVFSAGPLMKAVFKLATVICRQNSSASLAIVPSFCDTIFFRSIIFACLNCGAVLNGVTDDFLHKIRKTIRFSLSYVFELLCVQTE